MFEEILLGRKLIASDNAGNKAFMDLDGKLGVYNREGQLVMEKDAERFLKSAGIKTIRQNGRLFASR